MTVTAELTLKKNTNGLHSDVLDESIDTFHLALVRSQFLIENVTIHY